MINRIFNKNSKRKSSGVYLYKDNDLIELEKMPEEGSINSIIESIGYDPNQVHTVYTFDSQKIETLGFRIFSKVVIFALSKNNKRITESDILKVIRTIDWDFEYSSLNVEDILNDGIEAQNLSLEFLKTDMELIEEDRNLFKSEKYNLFLQFENNILQSFASSSWDDSASKWLKSLNDTMYSEMLEEARIYHDTEMEATLEVNMQANALLNIPDAMKNEFIPFHTKPNGNIHFFNLNVARYTQKCEFHDFAFVNKGRMVIVDELEFEVGEYIYQFDSENELLTVYEKK